MAGLLALAGFVREAHDSDHVIYNLVHRFGAPLGELESVPGGEEASDCLGRAQAAFDAALAQPEEDGRVAALANARHLSETARDVVIRSNVEERWLVWALTDVDELQTRIAWELGEEQKECLPDGTYQSEEVEIPLRTMASLMRLEGRVLTKVTHSSDGGAAAAMLDAQLRPVYEEWQRADLRLRKSAPGYADAPSPRLGWLADVVSGWGANIPNYQTAREMFPATYFYWS